MTRLTVALVAVAVTSVLAATPAASAASKATYYVSVGDSLAQGYEPIGGPLSPLGVDGYAQGYANQLFKEVRDRYEQLRLVKLGCGGETTLTMVLGAAYCVAALALLADFAIGGVQRVLSPRGIRRRPAYEPDVTTGPALGH